MLPQANPKNIIKFSPKVVDLLSALSGSPPFLAKIEVTPWPLVTPKLKVNNRLITDFPACDISQFNNAI